MLQESTLRKLSPVIIVLVVLVTIGTTWLTLQSRFEYDVESFFSPNDPELAYYHQFRETFENDNDFVLIGLANREGIFKQDFLLRVDSLTRALKKLDRIRTVQSPTTLYDRVLGPFGITRVPMIHLDEPERFAEDSARIYQTGHLVNAYFSPDAKAVSLYLKKEEFTPKAVNDSLLGAINDLIRAQAFDEYHVGGRIRTQSYYVGQMGKEMPFFAVLAIALLFIYLFLSFRTIWGIFVPIIVVVIAMTWTIAFMHLTGKELDLLTTMLPTLLFVIGISGTVHLVSKYAEEVHFGTEKFTAIKRTIKEVGLATFLTSFTTAIGFFSLITMDNVPVREFGIYTGVGVLFTYVVAILLLPAVMVQLPPKRMARTLATPARFWRQSLTGIFTWSLRNYRWVLVACAGVVILSIFGLSRVRVDNYFLDDLQPQSGLYQDLHFFQDNFSGIRPFEMSVDLVDTSRSLLDLEVVRSIETVETYLREKYGAGFLLSPATIVKATHQTINGGMPQQYRLPGNEAAMKKVATNLRKYNELRRLRHLITEDLRQGRITGKMDDIGSEAALAMNADLEQFVAANTDPELVTFKLTGAATLMDNNSRNITGNLVLGLSLALLIIGALMGLLFRSWKMVVISLVPNILPLLIIGSVLGFFDVHLRVSTSLIFTIAFGIAVDDTIHFLSKLKLELRRGRSFVAAARNTFLSTGKAIILTSLILTSGFSVFLWSDFQGTFIIGSLICLTLLIAVVADLFLLPALLLWMFGDQDSE